MVGGLMGASLAYWVIGRPTIFLGEGGWGFVDQGFGDVQFFFQFCACVCVCFFGGGPVCVVFVFPFFVLGGGPISVCVETIFL